MLGQLTSSNLEVLSLGIHTLSMGFLLFLVEIYEASALLSLPDMRRLAYRDGHIRQGCAII